MVMVKLVMRMVVVKMMVVIVDDGEMIIVVTVDYGDGDHSDDS